MFKRDVEYTDYNGVKQVDTYYFHLSEAELIEMELAYEGGFGEALTKIIESQDRRAVIEEFKKLILMSIGKKSEDGKRFAKTPEYTQEFQESAAYSVLFLELALKEAAAAEFINELMPAGITERLQEMVAANQAAAKTAESSPTAQEMLDAAKALSQPALPPPAPSAGH